MATVAIGTRERILRATLGVIAEHGIGAVTNRRVARAAGLSLGSLTYHFPDQTELLRESLLLFVREETELIVAATEELRRREVGVAEAAAEVQRIVERTSGPEQVAGLELHLHASRDPELREAALRTFAAYDALAAAALDALGIPDAGDHAPAVVALMYGLALRRLASGDRDATGTAHALMLLAAGARQA